MCTVTYIKDADNIFFTSNRDESLNRTLAKAPEWQEFAHGKILFPKDGHAGGSWIGVHENGHIGILLNGAEKAHTPQPPYRRSRGLIMLDLLNTSMPVTDQFERISLFNIEPFTLLLLDTDTKLYQLRWNGLQKSVVAKNEQDSHIWSSSTLYQPDHIQQRSAWFNERRKENKLSDTKHILDFHTNGGIGNPDIDLKMYRSQTKMQTVSISHIAINGRTRQLHYFDLVQNNKTVVPF